MSQIDTSAQQIYLGGTLFVPALEPDLINMCRGVSYPTLRSIVIDLSVHIDKSDTPYALHKLQKLLAALHHLHLEEPEQKRPDLFIQVPNPESFETINCLHHIELCQGFVLPDFDEHNMQAYMNYYIPDKYYQPIFNTPILDGARLDKIAGFLERFQKNIVAIRLGDAMLKQGHKHYDCQQSYHDIYLMQQMISLYQSHFQALTISFSAPSYPCIAPEHKAYFLEESKKDLMQGLWGKTLIHPVQIEWFNQAYQVTEGDYVVAKRLLDNYSPVSFFSGERLYHKHHDNTWALSIQQRARVYGVAKADCSDHK